LALFYPLAVYPQSGDVIDPTEEVTFKWQVQGTSSCVAYQLLIYDINNTAIYAGSKTTLPTPLYNGEILEIKIAANGTNCVVGNGYKQRLLMYYDSTNYVTSQGDILFYARTTPAVTLNIPTTLPHNLQYYTFTFTYTQSENTPIKSYKYVLYDSNMNTLDTYEKVGTSKTDYYVDGLVSGQSYYIQVTVINQEDVIIISDLREIQVEYRIASLAISPLAVNNKGKNAVDLSYVVSQIIGSPSRDTGYEFVEDFIYQNYNGVHILDNNYISFTVNIDSHFTAYFDFKRYSTYTGNIITLVDKNSNTYILSYNGSNYIYSINGVETVYSPTPYMGNYFTVVLQPTRALFYPIDTTALFPSDTLIPSDTLFPSLLTMPA